MGETVDLKPVRLEENHGFVSDCCRYQEGMLTQANMKLKYGFADSVWQDPAVMKNCLQKLKRRKFAG